ncbi:ring finger protein, putative [Ricinus communis]|uniref:RING-type E3 ubiquitin transferase n=1 Tax=Ricinus communis TaxID=3988 RepID=B9SNU8_RICCO|nr:ring finger protein, putative [Ricinus communis]|eukprot:XP_002527667.1 E3 ubiquitin-protein ligase Os04g0590900 [Ricinus communis]
MASLGTPKTWIPYVNGKDCSKGFCSLYCPQWCYIIFPPPPPPPPYDEFPDDNSGPTFSPLVIAIIGILVSAFLLVSYYTIISKYCGNNNNDSARRRENQDQIEELEDNHNPSLHEPWHVTTTGLDEALIKSITMCKYRKGDGLIEGTDCSVCLSEFQEDESIRLLPKCSHAFHVSCIDTWLKSHSNCPLCRANIIFISASLPPLPPPPPPLMESLLPGDEPIQGSNRANANVAVAQDIERERVVSSEDETVQNHGAPKAPLRVFSDLGSLEERDAIIEIRDERYHRQHIRRSFSLDHPCQSRASVADILRINQDEDVILNPENCLSGDAGSSKHSVEVSKSNSHRRKRVLLGVLSPVTMKRSFSSGRFFLTKHGRVRDFISPV